MDLEVLNYENIEPDVLVNNEKVIAHTYIKRYKDKITCSNKKIEIEVNNKLIETNSLFGYEYFDADKILSFMFYGIKISENY